MIKDSEVSLRVTGDAGMAEDWALVLVSLGLSPNIRKTQEGYVLTVPAWELQSAVAALSAYDQENPPHSALRDQPVAAANLRSGTAVAVVLLLFFFTSVVFESAVPWLERGNADAQRILRGELWRTVTALTLHADAVHALSNAVAAVVFLSPLYGILGTGLGSALVLAAGAGGNLANAFLRGPPHVSVGASTAIFSAVGMLGSFGMARLRRSQAGRRRAWLPIAAAIALLAMLGAGSPRVDVLAHLFGFLLGGICGFVFAFAVRRPLPAALQWILGSLSLAVIIGCWTLALR